MIPRKLYGVFFRVLILVSSLIVLTIYWRTHYEYHSKQLNPHELTLEGNYIPEQVIRHFFFIKKYSNVCDICDKLDHDDDT